MSMSSRMGGERGGFRGGRGRDLGHPMSRFSHQEEESQNENV